MSDGNEYMDVLKVEHFGLRPGEEPFLDEVNRLMAEAGRALQGDRAAATAEISIKIKFERSKADETFTVSHDIVYTPPKVRRSPVIAWSDRHKRLLTQAGKQMELPVNNVVDMATRKDG